MRLRPPVHRQQVPEGSAASPTELGRLRHEAAFHLIKEATKDTGPHIEHYTRTRFRDIPDFSPDIAAMRVEDFYARYGLNPELRGATGGYGVEADAIIGDLEIDHAPVDPITKLASSGT